MRQRNSVCGFRAWPIALPGPFLRFIGVAEVAGALGLILPGLLRIRQALTPLAASVAYGRRESPAMSTI